jgi:hypothetical protein
MDVGLPFTVAEATREDYEEGGSNGGYFTEAGYKVSDQRDTGSLIC